MLGNLSAPRVGLEDGCRFKGNVDMESAQAQQRPPQPGAVARPAEGVKGALPVPVVGPVRPEAASPRG
jgi:hypothetical protein